MNRYDTSCIHIGSILLDFDFESSFPSILSFFSGMIYDETERLLPI